MVDPEETRGDVMCHVLIFVFLRRGFPKTKASLGPGRAGQGRAGPLFGSYICHAFELKTRQVLESVGGVAHLAHKINRRSASMLCGVAYFAPFLVLVY